MVGSDCGAEEHVEAVLEGDREPVAGILGGMKDSPRSEASVFEETEEGARVPLAGGQMNESPSSEASVLDEVVLGGGRVPVGRAVLGAIKESDSRDRDDEEVTVDALVLMLDEAEESVGAAEGRRESRSIRHCLEAWRIRYAESLVLVLVLVLVEIVLAEEPVAEERV